MRKEEGAAAVGEDVGADSATPAGAVGAAVADRFGSEVSAHCSPGSRA